MKSRNPTAEEKRWMSSISQIGCIVCLLEHEVYSPAMIHHIDGKVKPGAHFKTLPLCFNHHQSGKDCEEYTSRHPYKARFEARYGAELELLEKVKGMAA